MFYEKEMTSTVANCNLLFFELLVSFYWTEIDIDYPDNDTYDV